ncbi:unnamed protein product [Timema podura]|uniref:Uncharacterized protein n=1 Tax=Timema podura TaxID=61482 RepID=A0ABN7NHR8_TIMPD|nr:unnamed protein product [Timema podura]
MELMGPPVNFSQEYSANVAPKQVGFSPYADNGGSIVAIAGEDYAIIASDTRLSSGFSIYTRELV